MARVLLGVSGGIAAYKACEICRLLVKAGHDVVPLVTPAAERFVTAETFRALARRPSAEDVYLHLTRADLLLVTPCTANTLAKLAHGLADNVLTEAALAHRGPTLVAPAMNPRMWSHAATRANAQTLRDRGVVLVGPDEGETAEGELGVGRMAEPEDVVRAAEALLAGTGPLRGKRVLVSAGGTREPIDSVRFIGNRSSGRMGMALAEQAARRGAEVTLVAANVSLGEPAGVRRIDVETAAELAVAVRDELPGNHVLLMAAAVADFRPARAEAGKIPREGSRGLDLFLEQTEDVLAQLAPLRDDDQILVGFAAEHGADAIDRARAKLERKGLDAIVFNDVSRTEIGFDSELNEVVIVERDGEHRVALAPKEDVAGAILDRVEALRGVHRGSGV